MRRMPDQAHSVPNISVLRSYMCMPTLSRNNQCTKIASKRAFWDKAQVNQMLLTVTSNRNIAIITPNLLRAELIRRNINMTFYLVLSLYVKACLSLKFIFNVRLQWRHMSVTGLSSHQQLDYFFLQLARLKTRYTTTPYYWPFVRGIHWWRVVSLTKFQWRGKRFHVKSSSWMTAICWTYKPW